MKNIPKFLTLVLFVLIAANELFAAVDINEWLIIGPMESSKEKVFSKSYLPEETILPNAGDAFGDMKWIKYSADKGSLDFMKAFGIDQSKRYVVAYACAYVYSDYDMPARLLLGSDDGIQAWVNGLKVWAINTNRGTVPGDDIVNIHLSKGFNRILLRVNQDYGGWGFSCSVDADFPVKSTVMNFSKKQVLPANNKKVWVPMMQFKSNASGMTDISIKMLNSGQEIIPDILASLEYNGASIAEVPVKPFISGAILDKHLLVSSTALAGFLSQKNPALRMKIGDAVIQEEINSATIYDATLEIGRSLRVTAIPPLVEKIKAINLLFGKPDNLKIIAQEALQAIQSGKEKDIENAYKKIYDQQASYLSDHSNEHIHVIGHGHLDMNWLWPTAETKKASHDNLRQTVAFMEEFPDFTMLQSQAAIYKQVEQQDPDLFKKMQKYVAAGRLEPVGGMWSEGDCNLTGGEAIIRSFLLGQTYFKEKFGKTAKVGWLPDNFGHPSQLAQILKLAGCDYFYFMRCHPYAGTFWWYGSDSSKILCFSNNGGYCAPVTPAVTEQIRDIAPEKKRILFMAGVGDHGGGPTRKDIETVHLLQQRPKFSDIRFTTAENFFTASTAEMDGRPSHKGEMQYTLEGCYTSIAEIKEANRNSEHALYQSEFMASMNWMLRKKTYPGAQLHNLWEMAAYNQFHDILPGSAIYESYKEATADHYYIQKNANDIRDEAFRSLAAEIKYNTQLGQPIVAVNMHPFGKKMLVEAEFFSHEKPLTCNPNGWYDYYISNQINAVNVGQGYVPTVLLRDGKGHSYPAQIVWSKLFPPGYRSRVLFVADSLPAAGYSTFYVDASKPGMMNEQIPYRAHEFETDYFKVGFDFKTGEIKRLLDKKTKVEYASNEKNLNQLKVFMEKGGDAWVIGKIDHVEDVKDVQNVSVTENGPVRACVEAQRKWGKSQIIQRTYVYRAYPRIDVELEVHWFESSTDTSLSPFLKTVFPISLANPRFDCHVPFDVVKRPTTGQEVPAQQWVDLSDDTKGIAVLNTSKYGHSYKDGQLELSLMRSTHFPDKYPNMGVFTIRYSIYPHTGDWKNGVWNEGDDFNIPVYAAEPPSLSQGKEKAKRAEEASFINVYPNEIVMSGIKQSEDGKEIIVRLAEVEGKTSQVTVMVPVKVKKARRLNIIEEPLSNVAAPMSSGNKIKITIRPHEIVTLGVKF